MPFPRHPEGSDRFPVAGLLPLLALLHWLAATPGAASPSPQEEETCRALLGTAVADTELLTAVVVTGQGALPDHCRVRGYIRPAIHFEMRLPTRAWNRKFYMSGCGGFCGEVLADRPGYANGINVALERGYAAVTTDAGHWGGKLDATWAYHNRQAEIDYAYRSIGEVSRVAERLIERFYSEEVRYSYFSGCSNGGRMAAIAAQRFPSLFDGIISGAPVLQISKAGAIFGAWLIKANTAASGAPVFRPEMQSLVAESVLQACDGLDGIEDGQIDDPRRCRFDPGTLECGAEQPSTECLRAAEVETLRKWYQGPRNSDREQLFAGVPYGSEPFWPVWLTGNPEAPPMAVALAESYLRFVAFESDPGPTYSPLTFDFDKDPARLAFMGRLLDADDPDLAPFKATGGKLIMFHGWADPVVLPQVTVEYYESVISSMGGLAETADFSRLFMVPGMGHCWELPGQGPDRFDPITALEAWVERGIPPDSILAEKRDSSGNLIRTRPLCPYPQVARYMGSGDPDAAANFRCVAP